MDNAYGEGVGSNFVVVVVDNDNKDQMMYNQLVVETTECKSPCSSSAEMCIKICA